MERLPEEPVEHRPARAGLVGGPHLPEDLALARNERVEPGRDAEEVQSRVLVAQPVELDLPGAERCDRACLGLVRIAAHEVELGAVAGREADRLAPIGERRGKVGRGLEVDRDPLPVLHRREPVRRADEDEAHAKCPICRLSWSATTSAKPASVTYAARRPRQPAPYRSNRNAP